LGPRVEQGGLVLIRKSTLSREYRSSTMVFLWSSKLTTKRVDLR
jgi:hypothetical protein